MPKFLLKSICVPIAVSLITSILCHIFIKQHVINDVAMLAIMVAIYEDTVSNLFCFSSGVLYFLILLFPLLFSLISNAFLSIMCLQAVPAAKYIERKDIMNTLCKKLLKMVYDHNQDEGGSLQIDAYGYDLGYKTARALKTDIDYLVNGGYVRKDVALMRAYSLAITEKGELFVENGFKLPYEIPNNTTSNVFNIQNATNSIIGTQTNVTMNIGDVIQQAREDIDASDSSDKEELHKIIDILEDAVNHQPVMKKGLLSKFASVIQKNSWIASPVTSVILKWLTSI